MGVAGVQLPGVLRGVAPLLACVAAVLVCPSPAVAAGQWGRVETLSGFPAPASAAIDDRGYIVLAWSRGATITRRVYGARRTPTRGFGEPFAIDTSEQARFPTDVQFDDQRNAIVVYTLRVPGGDRMNTRTVRPSGARTDATTVASVGSSPRFPALPAGAYASEPLLAWLTQDADGPLVGSARASSGLFGEAALENLPDSSDTLSINSLRFAVTGDESLLAAYDEGSLFVNERQSGGAFGPPLEVSTSNFPVDEPRIAVGADGRVALAWTELFGDGTRGAFASVRLPGGGFSAPVRVSAPGEFPVDVDVVVTSEGVVRVAYLAGGPRDSSGPLRLVTLGGTRETLTAGGTDALDLEIAADGRGGTTVAWQRGNPGNETGRNAIFARAVTPSGRVGARRKLTRRGEDGGDLTLAVGADGSALVAWTAGEVSVGDQFRAVRRSATGR